MVEPRPLGRVPAPDDKHLQRYPLTAGTMPTTPTPVVLGMNWYRGFDVPTQDRQAYWIGRGAGWGSVRGGHCLCAKPPAVNDTDGWWAFYDQGVEGACVGFGISRYASLMNRLRYDGFALYHEAQRIDEWPGENYSGTSVRAGLEVARTQGLWRVRAGTPSPTPRAADGIDVYRWARSVEEVAACLDPPDGTRVLNAGYVVLLNSWGRTGYPHYVRLPLGSLDRLIYRENGDASVATDR